jgi:uncharacterized protein
VKIMHRRTFLAGSAISTLSATALLATKSTTFELQTDSIKIVCNRLPQEFSGYRIGFISDLHLGDFIPLEWIEHCLSSLIEMKPDLLIVGGDLVDAPKGSAYKTKSLYSRRFRSSNTTRPNELADALALYNQLAALLQSFSPRDGIAVVLGNHDHWFPSLVWQEAIRSKGACLLVNEWHTVVRGTARLNFYGIDDYLTGIPLLPSQVNGSSNVVQDLHVLVSHNPDLVGQLMVLPHTPNRFDLALCGHTHGGQINLPIVGAPTYNVHYTQLAKGLATFPEHSVFTSRGVGVVEIPVRINCPAEVTLIELTR